MKIRPEEITTVLERELEKYEAALDVDEVGTVLEVGDGIARIYGLSGAMSGEMLDFGNDLYGLALNLEEDVIGAVILGDDVEIKEGAEVRRTSRVLEVPGRTSGEPRQVPVNLLTYDGEEYLVSPRGHGQWVRNVRANDGHLDLLLGRQRHAYVATEVADDDKVDVLRAYLTRWKVEVGPFFDGTPEIKGIMDGAGVSSAPTVEFWRGLDTGDGF